MKRAFFIIMLLSFTVLFACKEREEPPPTLVPTPLSQSAPMEADADTPPIEMMHGQRPKSRVEVPDVIQYAWEAVEMDIIDRKTNESETVTVKRGEETAIKESTLKFTVTHFIPNFTMGNGMITSLNGNPENPAVRIIVTENGEELWVGVAFMQYPDTHAFEHERYSIIMKNFIPVK